jgi:hypothetical protein
MTFLFGIGRHITWQQWLIGLGVILLYVLTRDYLRNRKINRSSNATGLNLKKQKDLQNKKKSS